jgi:superfamily II DNA or RNA helicase
MHIDQGKTRILLVAPTRSGKMVLVAAIARSSTLPLLFLCHRLELIDQCAEELSRVGLSSIGVIRADDSRSNPSASVQVASLATLARRAKPWLGQKIIIIIDECHRAASESYRTLIDEYVSANPEVIVIGFTATPCRLDGKPLGDIFEVLETVCTYQELLKNPNWLIAPDIYALPPPDLSAVRQTMGEYDEDEAATAMSAINGDVVDHWLRHAHRHPEFTPRGDRVPQKYVDGPRRRTFLFACNIAHSLALCARFEAAGVRVAHLDGKTPETERRSLLKALATGDLEILSNVNILLEGVNVPEAKCVCHVRPTQSLTLWRQSSCRVLTPWNGVRPLILDHAGNTDRLDLPHIDLLWSLSDKPKRRGGAVAMKVCKSCYAYVEAGRSVCPHCGAEFKTETRAATRATQESDAQLQQRSAEPDAAKRLFFDRHVLMAKSKGFKPGFAAFKFKEHYGNWPPREWSNEAKLTFASDTMWQAQLNRRLERKAEREEQEKAEEKALDRALDGPLDPASPEAIAAAWKAKREGTKPAPEPEPYEEEETFGDWLESHGIT